MRRKYLGYQLSTYLLKPQIHIHVSKAETETRLKEHLTIFHILQYTSVNMTSSINYLLTIFHPNSAQNVITTRFTGHEHL